MASNSLSFNAPQIFTGKNYQNWLIKTKSYFETYALCDVVIKEKSLQQHFANPIKVKIKALSEELLDMTRLLKTFSKHKVKRRKRKKKKFLKSKNNVKNSASTPKAEIEEEHFF